MNRQVEKRIKALEVFFDAESARIEGIDNFIVRSAQICEFHEYLGEYIDDFRGKLDSLENNENASKKPSFTLSYLSSTHFKSRQELLDEDLAVLAFLMEKFFELSDEVGEIDAGLRRMESFWGFDDLDNA